jgi:hypothetical protein
VPLDTCLLMGDPEGARPQAIKTALAMESFKNLMIPTVEDRNVLSWRV